MRRGSAYILILGVSSLLTVIGLSAVGLGRVRLRAALQGEERLNAQVLAASIVEQALVVINTSEQWRRDLQGATVEGELVGAEFSWHVTDPEDGDLTDDPAEPAQLTVRVDVGDAVTVLRVAIEPDSAPGRALWGVDQQDGELFSIEDYYGPSRSFTSYGPLQYRRQGRLRDLGHGTTAWVVDADQTAYMVYARDLNGISGPLLLSVPVDQAREGQDHEVSVIGSLGTSDGVTALAIDPATGDLYGLAPSELAGSPDHLVKIDKSNGQVIADVGPMAGAAATVQNGRGMVFDHEGSLYAVDAADGQLCRLNKINASVEEVCDAETEWMNDVQALAWDSANGRLLGSRGDRMLMHLAMGQGDAAAVTDLGAFGLRDVRGIGFVTGQAGAEQEPRDMRPVQSPTAIGLVVR